ncbi:MAG: zinc metalloprotease HtpX [Nanoarchaeota archaeon]|nr:zinc metalloprotease HtpX [Nanoarchaeota archaeon]
MDNRIKTVLFLGLLTGIVLGIGSYWGYAGLVLAFVFVVVMNFFSYFFSDKIVLKMYRAKEVTENDQKELFKLVREVVALAGIPMPKIYVVASDNPNAFATGRDPKHAAIAVTTGIMDLLEKDELKGVIAHEISHVKNRDILISSVAATIAGVISMVGVMTRWGAMFGGFGGRDGDNNIVTILVLGIVTPIMAFLIQMAISRSREYLADESAARILHSPHGLIKALEKLENGVKRHPLKFGSKAGASLFIVNPFSMRGLTKFLSTHPPMEDRIKKLKALNV